MSVPTKFRSGGSDINASYDWFDFAAGTGYKRFYCSGLNDSVGLKYVLTTNNIDSDAQNRYISGAGANYATLDFETTFKHPQYVSGVVNLGFTMGVGGAGTYSCNFEIFHVRGATATSLGSVTSATQTAAGVNTIRFACKLTLTSKKFAINDTIRVRVKPTTNGPTGTLFYDTGSRQTITESGTGATISTSMYLDIPFKIEL